MILCDETFSVSSVVRIETFLCDLLLRLQSEQPGRRFMVKVAYERTKVFIPSLALETVLDLLIDNSKLFPSKRLLTVTGSKGQGRYLLRLASLGSELSEDQCNAIKCYRKGNLACMNNSLLATVKARLLVESYKGRFLLKGDDEQGLIAEIVLRSM